MINSIDILIIYLASGAPFGVYYYLNHRTRIEPRRLWFKSLFNFLFWLPLAISILRREINFGEYFNRYRSIARGGEEAENEIVSVQKRIESIFTESRFKMSVYEFREIIERYIGLTLAGKSVVKTAGEHEKELFRISETDSVELGAICLNRRNRRQLFAHQIAARRDFLQLIGQLAEFGGEPEELKDASNALTELLQDFEARHKIERMFDEALQIKPRAHVKKLEKDLWKPAARLTPNVRPNSHLHPVNSVPMNLRTED